MKHHTRIRFCGAQEERHDMDHREPNNASFWKRTKTAIERRLNPEKERHLEQFRAQGIPQVDQATRNAAKEAIEAHNLRYSVSTLIGDNSSLLPTASRGISVTPWDGNAPRGLVVPMEGDRHLEYLGNNQYKVYPKDVIARDVHALHQDGIARYELTAHGRRIAALLEAQEPGPSRQADPSQQNVRRAVSEGQLRSQPTAPEPYDAERIMQMEQQRRAQQALRARRSEPQFSRPEETPPPVPARTAQPQDPAKPPGLDHVDPSKVLNEFQEMDDHRARLAQAAERARARDRSRSPGLER
jgi:hypothetical protein